MNNNIKHLKGAICISSFPHWLNTNNINYLDTVLDSKTNKSIHLGDAMVDAARRGRRRRWMQRRRDHRNTDAVAIQGTIRKQMTTHPASLRQNLSIRFSLILHPQITTQLSPNRDLFAFVQNKKRSLRTQELAEIPQTGILCGTTQCARETLDQRINWCPPRNVEEGEIEERTHDRRDDKREITSECTRIKSGNDRSNFSVL